MSVVRIDNFGGLVETKDPKKGPFWTALKANNCDIRSGSVDVFYNLSLADAVNLTGAVGRKKIYNITGTTFLEWSQDIDVARSVLADNSSSRVYYTGDDVPKATDYGLAIGGAAPYPIVSYVLGLPIPNAIVTANETVVGTGNVETRAYVCTIVSGWGEESAPSAPKVVNAHEIGSTVELESIGLATRGYSGVTPAGIPISGVAWIAAPAPGFLRLTVGSAAYYNDVRPGDRVHVQFNNRLDQRYKSYVVGATNGGAGTIDVPANVWDNIGAAPTFLWRCLPLNSFNIIGAVSIAGGKVKVSVDNTNGLRATEKVVITSVVGMTDLNATWSVDSVGSDDPLNPSFVVACNTVQAYASGGRADRTAKHNTGDIRITGATFAAGVCTLTLEHVGGINVGNNLLIVGIMGAYQANGLRTMTAVNAAARTVSFALAAMTAYTGGGVAILESPETFETWPIFSVAASGAVLPAPNIITINLSNAAPTLVADDMVLGYDVGGAIELNTVMRVAAKPAAAQLTVQIAGPMTAFTAGGRLVKVKPQYHKRLYRTATGTQAAEYEFLVEMLGDEGRYKDVVDAGALGDVIESTEWIQPPADMISLIGHPHGFFVGASKNILCMSEPYQLHAWPIKYQIAMPTDIVGVGIYGTTIVVFTHDVPINVIGYLPGQMTRARQDVGEACTSKRSITSTGLGVLYRGSSGMFLIGYAGSDNATKNYLNASNFVSASDTIGKYWGNKIIWIDNATQAGYIFDPVREDKGLTQFSLDYAVYDLHVSPIDGQLWASYVDTGQAKRAPLFKIVSTPAKFNYWTQHIQLSRPVSLGALKVEWDWHLQSAALKDREAMIVRNLRQRSGRFAAIGDHAFGAVSIGGDELETVYTPNNALTIPTERFLKVTVIAEPQITDKTTIVFDDFVVNDNPVRIANGIKSDVWQIKLEGNARVSAVTIAESIHEMANV